MKKEPNYLIIPNGNITKQVIINFHYPNRMHALKCSVGVEYGAAPNDVKNVLRQAVRHTADVLPREPRIRLKQFGDSPQGRAHPGRDDNPQAAPVGDGRAAEAHVGASRGAGQR